jgi:hypothetical protein
VVDDGDVDAAELADAFGHTGGQLGAVPGVARAGHDPPVQVLDELGRLRQVVGGRHRVRHAADLVADVDGDDVAPLLGQAQGVAASLSPCRSGDQRDLAVHPSHNSALLVLSVLG